jgi:hypothetical protein
VGAVWSNAFVDDPLQRRWGRAPYRLSKCATRSSFGSLGAHGRDHLPRERGLSSGDVLGHTPSTKASAASRACSFSTSVTGATQNCTGLR